MTSAQAILLFIFLTNTAVGCIVFGTNPRRSQNQLFLLFSASLTAWVLFVLNITSSQSSYNAELGIRGASIAGAFIPVTFYLFCQSISNPELSFLRLCSKSKGVLILSVIISLMCGTRFFLQSVTMPTPENGFHVPRADYGPGFIVFILFFPMVIYRTIFTFYKILKSSAGIAKTEMQFALTGMTSALPIAVIIHLVAIVSGSSDPQQYGPLCIIPMNLVIAYGIATRRILGIETVLRRAIAYALLAGFLVMIYVGSWYTVDYLLSDALEDPSLVAQITATIFTILLLTPAQQRMNIAAKKLIAGKSVDTTAMTKKASEIFRSVSTIDLLLKHFSQLLGEALAPKEIALLSLEKRCFQQQYPKTDQTRSLDIDDPIPNMLRKTKNTICRDSLVRLRETAQIRAVKQVMKQTDLSIAVGIFLKDNLEGVLLMGPKVDGEIYDRNEQDALQILCNQFAVALENAHLYTEMQDSKIRNEIMLEQLVSGVIVANPDRKITLINHEAQRITGLSEAETLGQVIDLLPQSISEALETTLATQSGLQNTDTVLFADEEERTMHISMGSAYLLGHDEKPMGALLVFTDMTEVKGLEEQVRRADQLSSVGTLAAGMAHEIKNPLVTIKTFTQLLPDRYEDADFRRDFSSLVAHEVSRIDGIVNHLLHFSKPSKPNLVPINLHNTIEKTLELIHEQLLQKNIELRNHLRAGNDRISGDADLLTQSLVNFNLNAIEAIGSDGIIKVVSSNCTYRFARGEDPGEAVTRTCIRLQISDTGQGISQEQLQKIFDPFFTSKSEGTGMGLSVAHGIIHEHHGAIEVDSIPGKGTTFSIYIPILEEDAAA